MYVQLRKTNPRDMQKDWTGLRLWGDNTLIASADLEQDCMGHDSYAWFWSVWVDEQLRGKKVGELLMVSGLIEASRRGQKIAKLYVYSTNKSARRLYEKVGFKYEREFPIVHGDRIEPDWPYPSYEGYREHRRWMDACTWAEVCPVPWINDVYEWTMTMHIELTPEKVRELRRRRKELRQLIGTMQA